MGLHVVLINPEIPWNTGNIGRTCLGVGATLHLVGECGFSLEDKYLKRAGLDYWPRVKCVQHKDFETFLDGMEPGGQLSFFSARATTSFWDARFAPSSYLVFGQETKGLPKEFWERYQDRFFRIPITDNIRSLNLSSSVAVALFEAHRQMSHERV